MNFETEADRIIAEALDLNLPKSFFLFAGAGAGKTRSLVNALQYIKNEFGKILQIRNKKVGVITYTNVAVKEISERIEHDSLFTISTIHSFAWNLIKGFDVDIKRCLYDILQQKIIKKEKDYLKILERLAALRDVKHFIYDPASGAVNSGIDSLSHSEVIQICSKLLLEKPLMANILVQRFPILFIDEAQDTDRELMDALLFVKKNNKEVFSLGLFGDTKQRIYSSGKENMGTINWKSYGFEVPEKLENHRSGSRIVDLANKIGRLIDNNPEQEKVESKGTGIVRLFVVPTDVDKKLVELKIKKRMAEITKDPLWNKDSWSGQEGAVLVLEHRMAAVRLGFVEMFDALRKSKEFDNVKAGTSSEINFFADFILPIVMAESPFEITNITRKYNKKLFVNITQNLLLKIKNSIDKIRNAYFDNPNITFGQMLQVIKQGGVFDVPRKFEENYEEFKPFLDTKFSQIRNYFNYIHELSDFRTHHGVKGQEFDNVMVVIDNDSRWNAYNQKGFFFNENVNAGTLRLLYVVCTRARKNLAIVLYTDKIRDELNGGWFDKEEIIDDIYK